jgi:hypothetical protein
MHPLRYPVMALWCPIICRVPAKFLRLARQSQQHQHATSLGAVSLSPVTRAYIKHSLSLRRNRRGRISAARRKQ